jgi:hemoglobin
MTEPAGKPDLDSRAAIHDVVVQFYREVVFDDVLEPMFGEVAEVDWAVHMPKLVDYWCRVLLREPGYAGLILDTHQHVHVLRPLTTEMFDRWYQLWIASIDGRWSGPFAQAAKDHAAHVGGVLSRRVANIEWSPTAPNTPV